MGIESDHLVYEYLSRVGDLAQQRQLPSGDRMRLVAGLRDEIDRRRARYEPETPAAVRRILERLGTPEEVVDGAGTGAGPAADPEEAAASVPAQRGPDRPDRPARRLRARSAPPEPPAAQAPAPPHLAGLAELGSGDGAEPDWWRVAPGPYGTGPQVEGFAGGIEIPELFSRPEDRDGEGPAAAKEPPQQEQKEKQTLLRHLRERRRARKAAPAAPAAPAVPAAAAARPKPHAFLLLAAAVLVVGAAAGSWLLLAGGWLLAYASRVLGPTERKAVVFGVPGAVFAGAVVWLWGRLEGRWGAPLADGSAGAVFQDMWPWLARTAAVASAAYLLWRSRRR
ncbi:HAAS signaling domain-containing protein [Streptomyces toxytricini]|uniref:HAAS signaling domain-containing protein n=1 Tax=Streptomyces toxytricini TaxID=67369 RepID=UPI00343BCB6A